MEKTILFTITLTQAYDTETFEPKVWVFDEKDKAFEFYKFLVKKEDENLSNNRYCHDWVYSEDNFEDYNNAEALFERYSEYSYSLNHFRVDLTTTELNPTY